jgi:acyl-CoA synthetase (AMP-forming)/AMP-acid ligase II
VYGYGLNGLKSPIRGEEVAECLMTFPPEKCTLLSYIPRNTGTRAILDPLDLHLSISHGELADFVEGFDLEKFGIACGCRVALVLPNGPNLAVCLICVMNKWCAVPVNVSGPEHEVQSELESTGAKTIIIQKGRTNDSITSAASKLGLGILELIVLPSKCGLFTLSNDITTPSFSSKGDSVCPISSTRLCFVIASWACASTTYEWYE